VLTTLSFSEDRITTAHRAKLLYVYVRQSSPGQVRHHQESTEQQYRLSSGQFSLAGRANAFTSSTMTWASRVRPAATDMASSG
jgi:hypothetical protein